MSYINPYFNNYNSVLSKDEMNAIYKEMMKMVIIPATKMNIDDLTVTKNYKSKFDVFVDVIDEIFSYTEDHDVIFIDYARRTKPKIKEYSIDDSSLILIIEDNDYIFDKEQINNNSDLDEILGNFLFTDYLGLDCSEQIKKRLKARYEPYYR